MVEIKRYASKFDLASLKVIFEKLPVRDVYAAWQVCKDWENAAAAPDLWRDVAKSTLSLTLRSPSEVARLTKWDSCAPVDDSREFPVIKAVMGVAASLVGATTCVDPNPNLRKLALVCLGEGILLGYNVALPLLHARTTKSDNEIDEREPERQNQTMR